MPAEMDEETESRKAQEILDNPLFERICREIVDESVEMALGADYDDDKTRLVSAMEIRLIRTIESKLKSLKGSTTRPAVPVA